MITQITKVEIYDDADELVANLEMMDSSSVTIEINYCTNATEWVKIAKALIDRYENYKKFGGLNDEQLDSWKFTLDRGSGTRVLEDTK